jgi:predicted RND superfamily exporter protein
MDKNTVLLNLNDYNELRDFKTSIENGEFLVAISSYKNGVDFYNHKFKLYTKEEAIKTLTNANNKLIDEIKEFLNSPSYIELDKLRKMSYWEFRKWKKGK